MKIGPLPDIPVGVNPPGSKKPEQGAAPAPAKAIVPATPGVAVTVSKLARTLGQAGPEVDPDIDSERVAQVKSAIDQGTYKVNPQVIADKLLTNAQDMLNRARR
ncbi:MAG TPA: flagellar biosynthesis anti-sigma factor FlgM [Burkholderiaceae bacterium]|nr:flagellar biosynthesis anti-sigma factor FlgM [Burkholderiaceae bacterium]